MVYAGQRDGRATILWRAVNFKQWSIGTKGARVCQETIPHTIMPPTTELLIQSWMDPCFHLVYSIPNLTLEMLEQELRHN